MTKKTQENPQREYFASCPKFMESLLQDELRSFGLTATRQTAAGVYFHADVEQVYHVIMWTRLANRVLMPLEKTRVISVETLYDAVYQLSWEEYFSVEKSFIVDFSGSSDFVRNTQFGAQKVKDAIVDRFVGKTQSRPSIDKAAPQVRVNARLSKGQLVLSLDLSGESLHRRGYRRKQGAAPLKENLAAAILYRSGWPAICETARTQQTLIALFDPMCGSGTLLIEGALMAANVAPGSLRETFGVEHLLNYQPEILRAERESARQREIDLAEEGIIAFVGCDADRRILDAAESNFADAGLAAAVKLEHRALSELDRDPFPLPKAGLIVSNPPYGERMGELEALRESYRQLGSIAKRDACGWRFALFTSNPELAREARLRPQNKYKFFNGQIATELLLYDMFGEEAKLREDPQRVDLKAAPLTENARMVMNRLKKNHRRLQAWRERERIECYRLYDADMPEYAAAVDVYGNIFHVQEYEAPKTINASDSRRRYGELLQAVAHAFALEDSQIVSKVRRRNRGKSQYERLGNTGNTADTHFFDVTEGQAKLVVNLHDYLDTGLFLDHRPLRKLLFETACGKRFLNLFCYTASATVQAALGGARASVSVDMSNTYLDWARRNLERNRINTERHTLIRHDCVQWLKTCREGFDIIMLDPPSFSNSKSTATILDIQRDHAALLGRCMELLRPGGILYFSCNLRSFQLDASVLEDHCVKDISAASLDPDFARNPKIHRCWEIRNR